MDALRTANKALASVIDSKDTEIGKLRNRVQHLLQNYEEYQDIQAKAQADLLSQIKNLEEQVHNCTCNDEDNTQMNQLVHLNLNIIADEDQEETEKRIRQTIEKDIKMQCKHIYTTKITQMEQDIKKLIEYKTELEKALEIQEEKTNKLVRKIKSKYKYKDKVIGDLEASTFDIQKQFEEVKIKYINALKKEQTHKFHKIRPTKLIEFQKKIRELTEENEMMRKMVSSLRIDMSSRDITIRKQSTQIMKLEKITKIQAKISRLKLSDNPSFDTRPYSSQKHRTIDHEGRAPRNINENVQSTTPILRSSYEYPPLKKDQNSHSLNKLKQNMRVRNNLVFLRKPSNDSANQRKIPPKIMKLDLRVKNKSNKAI
ncbi:unnamed protein product [Moneuplotes crassus]|uniref:Uncharacterized protein n=1 Tax=Euplotes crassus TaxID=5936 RepID=A0AAD1UPM1_EUPCR|nr:unnamed protein product [Moneuplotes crassus]